MKFTRILSGAIMAAVITLSACKPEKENPEPTLGGYFLGIEATSGTDVLVHTENLNDGVISPIGNGVEQPAWMTYLTNGNTLITSGYATDNVLTGYRVIGGTFTNIGSLITELQTYVYAQVDEHTMLAAAVTRAGYEDRIIYKINTESMSIQERTYTRIDERKDEGLVAWPTGMKVRDGKLFVPYYLMGSGEDNVDAFATPNSNQARVAIYSYPDMAFEKIITDDRTTDIGCYSSVPSIQEVETGDLYTFSTSSLASGFNPTPTNPSGFLRIKKGSSDFDDTYFFDFEAASGGYKINNAIYAGNGKMVVRMINDDSGLWATYNPDTENPICYIGIADLNAKTVTMVDDVPAHGGEWGMANLVHDGKVYINVSDVNGAHIYEIDPASATATKGAEIEGNWAKEIMKIEG